MWYNVVVVVVVLVVVVVWWSVVWCGVEWSGVEWSGVEWSHVFLNFGKVHNPLRLPCETASERQKWPETVSF